MTDTLEHRLPEYAPAAIANLTDADLCELAGNAARELAERGAREEPAAWRSWRPSWGSLAALEDDLTLALEHVRDARAAALEREPDA